MEAQPLVVLTTLPSQGVAAEIARALVTERLAACVNIIPGVQSIYVWEGKVCDEAECLCVIKTTAQTLPALSRRLTALHPYDVPEIVAIAPESISPPYRAWLLASVGG